MQLKYHASLAEYDSRIDGLFMELIARRAITAQATRHDSEALLVVCKDNLVSNSFHLISFHLIYP